MDKQEDNSWVFDSLVCFLNGPIWNAPLQSFIEEKSLIFEPGDTDNEEYKNIFDEFKNLVDCMLGNFMEDIGISPDQFQQACAAGNKYGATFDHNLFEQIWAANDYEMFVRMMTQKNVELQLQALELIERKYGVTPQSFLPKKDDNSPSKIVSNSEEQVLKEVSKSFTVDEDSHNKMGCLMKEKPILEQKLKKATIMKKETPSAKNEKETEKKGTINVEQSQQETSLTPKTEINLSKTSTEVDALELKKRQDYLRAQRDKLVALKKEARKKQLTAESGDQKTTKIRPKSAKAAEAALTGEKLKVESQLQLRKTLADRLRTEVVSRQNKN